MIDATYGMCEIIRRVIHNKWSKIPDIEYIDFNTSKSSNSSIFFGLFFCSPNKIFPYLCQKTKIVTIVLPKPKQKKQKQNIKHQGKKSPQVKPIYFPTIKEVGATHMDVSENSGNPQIIHFNRVFHYKKSISGYSYFWKHPYPSIFS